METNTSPQHATPTVEAVVGRLEIASRILAGLCANPSVIAHNHNCGWSLVNCTDADLAGYAVSLADALIADDANTPNPGGLGTAARKEP
jgi:hypothetical protein